MDPISPPLEPLQVRVRQIPPEADSSLPSHAANENSSASAEELPQVPSSKYPGTERAIRISRRDEQLPPMRLDKGKGRALSPSRPDDDEPLKGLSFRDELYAIGDVVTSSSVAEHQPVRHSVGWPPSGEPSGYNTATFCSRDYSPVFAGGDAPSAGYASGGYTTVHLRDTALASSPAVSRSAPTVSSGKVTTPSNTSTAAVPPVKGMFGVAPLITGLSLFAPPGKGPFYEPPPSRPPIPLFEPSPGLGYGCSACPIVIDDAPARHPARRGSPPQQAGLPTEVAVSSQPPDRSSSSQLGASSSTPIVIDDGTSQTRASEPSEPIDLGTPSPPPDAVVNHAAGKPSALVVDGSSSRDGTGSGSKLTTAKLTSLAQAALNYCMMYYDNVPIYPVLAQEPEPTPLEAAIEHQRCRALRTKPKRSSPLRFYVETLSADKKDPEPLDSTDDN